MFTPISKDQPKAVLVFLYLATMVVHIFMTQLVDLLCLAGFTSSHNYNWEIHWGTNINNNCEKVARLMHEIAYQGG